MWWNTQSNYLVQVFNVTQDETWWFSSTRTHHIKFLISIIVTYGLTLLLNTIPAFTIWEILTFYFEGHSKSNPMVQFGSPQFLLMFNSNIWPFSPPSRDKRLHNMSDLDCDRSRPPKVKCGGAESLSWYDFRVVFNLKIWPNSSLLRYISLQIVRFVGGVAFWNFCRIGSHVHENEKQNR